MAHRKFTDRSGRTSDAWTVVPTKVERRTAVGVEHSAERRHHSELRVRLGEHLGEGWLCFETRGEKRRPAPVPNDWETMSDAELGSLCEKASVAPRPRRLVE